MVQSAQREIARQMRGDEGQLKAAGEERRSHQQEPRMFDCLAERVAQRLAATGRHRRGHTTADAKRNCRHGAGDRRKGQ